MHILMIGIAIGFILCYIAILIDGWFLIRKLDRMSKDALWPDKITYPKED